MKRLSLWFFILLFASGALLFHQYSASILLYIKNMGAAAPLLFIALYVCATVFFLPTLMLTFTGGALFSPFPGTLYNLIGATGGAVLAFCISRYWLAKQVDTQQNNAFSRVIQGMDRHGWYFLALVRALPVIPFNLVNYGMGFTRMSLRSYTLITFLFLAPTEVFYTWCGFAGRKILSTSDLWSYRITLIAVVILGVLFLLYKGSKLLYRRYKLTQ